MAKFNTNTNKVKNQEPDTVNMEGIPAYSRDFEKEFASVILNSMLNGEHSTYQFEDDRIKQIQNLITDNLTSYENAEFVAKAMVYTRNEGNLRSVAHVIADTLASTVKGAPFTKKAFEKIMIRPDDATEIVSLWNTHSKKSIPNALRKAIKSSLENRWDAYQLRKYFGNGNVKVSNLINIAHPTPKNGDQEVTFKQALENKLPKIQTAQTVNAGSTGSDRNQNYKVMLKERKLGYMALLKNLKNILEIGADDEMIELICNLLENERAVLNSRLLPFRFTQAYEAVENINMDRFKMKKVLDSIEKGFIISARNIGIADEDEKVAILLDESGSMGWNVSSITSNTPFGIGRTLMASMLTGLDKNNVLGYLWADRSRRVEIDYSPMKFIKETRTQGGGTNLGQSISDLIKTGTVVDKIVIFTDMQENQIGMWGQESFDNMIKRYRKINPNVKVLFWNLEGYGRGTPLKLSHNVLEVNGFSDKMLQVIPKIWKDKDALIKEIRAIEL